MLWRHTSLFYSHGALRSLLQYSLLTQTRLLHNGTRISKSDFSLCDSHVIQFPQPLQLPHDIRRHNSQILEIDIRIRLEHISPHRSAHDRIAFDQTLIIRQLHTSPLCPQILEIPIPHSARRHAMPRRHAIFRSIEEVIEKVLMPIFDIFFGKTSQSDGQQPHVEIEHLRPAVECDFEP